VHFGDPWPVQCREFWRVVPRTQKQLAPLVGRTTVELEWHFVKCTPACAVQPGLANFVCKNSNDPDWCSTRFRRQCVEKVWDAATSSRGYVYVRCPWRRRACTKDFQ
jgi:hypothetical protein